MDYNSYNKVLLIEDNPGDARLVELLLAESDLIECEIHTCSDLSSGIVTLQAQTFDVVLLDLTLPDSRGFETLEKLFAQVPDANVIVLTGLTNKEIGIKSVKAGAQDFLVKGAFDGELLAKSLRYSIERNQVLKRLEEAQSLAHIGNWQYSPTQQTFSASDEIYRIFGFGPREYTITAKDISDHTSTFHILHKIHQEAILKGEIKRDEKIYRKNGEERYVSIQCQVLKDGKGEVILFSGIIQDITERKQAEEFRKVQESAKLKEQFLAQVSHDMRTPLSAIIYNLILGVDMGLDEQQYELFKVMRTNAEYLLSMINDILEFQSLQYGNVVFENEVFDFHEVLSNLFLVIQNKLSENNLEFELSRGENIPRYLIGDKHRLTRVLINLTGNAVKFTLKGFVKVIVEELDRTDDEIHLKFYIKDSGIGIPENKLDAIFGAFNRINHKERFFEGTGLGLSIVKNIVEKQGGNVGVESKLHEGSTFFFDLKFGISSAPIKEEVKVPQFFTNDKIYNILLVDDDQMISIPSKQIIENNLKNFKVHVVENGKQAIEILKEKPFDFILMDMQMPVMGGEETSLYIRENMHDIVGNIPIIAMTADGFTGKNERYKEYGMDDFIIKPFMPPELFEKISKHLK